MCGIADINRVTRGAQGYLGTVNKISHANEQEDGEKCAGNG